MDTARVVPRAQQRLGNTCICRTARITLDVDRLYDVETARRAQFGLTESQHETFVEAYERGYYTIPRKIDGGDLAAGLDISHQVLSERLRRGVRNFIENTVVVGDEAE
ncbi:helix-turn-helix domain-containing protein [Haladaptatus halobius]|uniref:helix-turn-helix domain-containing protein n=1 Tax=Haladaptatus halobius TaxID=2884875 RepID=UPI001D09EF3A|nr:helix-turn-helix domain-containing protein [Haladaptatus halobius]